jgi:Tfp pilus assembly protein PilO
MKALFAYSADVGWSRVIADHRRWLMPVGAVLVINVVVLIGVVLPLRQSVQTAEARANASAQALREAAADLRTAEATRDGQGQASQDLERFYSEVLPADFTTARRITHLKMSQLARSHDVEFESGSTTPESLRDSVLERLAVSFALVGDWDDIRQMIYEIETGADFVVIDNVGLSEGADPSAGLSLQLELSTYYRRTAAPGGPP